MERIRLEFPAQAVIHRHPLTMRITDMNYGRHLGHDTLVSLLHEARIQAFGALGLSEWDMGGFPSVVADLAVQYQSEARWPDALVVETAIPSPQGKSLVVYHRVCHAEGGKPVATARLNVVLVDPAIGRPVAIPDVVQRAIDGAESA
ncbi:acyl-CoA thioesterase [Halomonas campisalis]|uniref:Acyl-CoA thioesterase n=1 Tax=Billgrantia campisalis TaxID=74661 RepID=A0ABS9P7X4_9GAMM|nr:thioesterase family protein [Halomonas campisalis]MCG6657716.1 acyl-CoA thioesterase [Halomonas campisalis]MDR5862512.1 thioesterase family protein [Halomonas campisalis]